MPSFKLIVSAVVMNLHGLAGRRVNALVMIVSIAGVVAVFSGVLAMNAGLDEAMRDAGRSDRVIVLRAGSTVEIASAISHEERNMIANSADVRRSADGTPLITGEAVAPLTLIERGSGMEVNGTIRGVGTEIMALRPEIKIVQGRMFEPGKFEIVVGRKALEQFRGLAPGSDLVAYGTTWKVVGIYSAGRSIRESELMADVNTIMSVSHRPMFQNITVVLPGAEAFTRFKKALAANPSLAMDVFTEPEFLQRETQSLNRMLRFMAYVMGGIMALGATFVAINAMYSSIDDRRREIATLRAIGFPPVVVVASILVEAALLALVGGLLGAAMAWLVANGSTVSTAVGGDLRQLVFNVVLTPSVVLKGLCAALLIGVLGGLVPAVRSIKSQVVDDLRAI
ncbi:putative ABC transport system permease protein [Xanthomonas arboricola]|uniref:ABC transporter permease n=1 Tax=Xanthomonas euroxanthea TaxID=2259622 RepID=UPI001430A090|nr:ABC transporter permease [Xanthomonas euroxanthea]NJC37113.1 putative ABC transport system permease protein [Xanthomonas euroxanthea]